MFRRHWITDATWFRKTKLEPPERKLPEVRASVGPVVKKKRYPLYQALLARGLPGASYSTLKMAVVIRTKGLLRLRLRSNLANPK